LMNSYFAGPVLEKYVEEFSESQGLELELEEIQIQIQIQNILVTQVKPATSC
jgi:hypothetical protein